MIVVLGIFNADTAYRADRMPRLGETIMGRGFALGAGGKGSNQAVAAARAGGDVTIVTRLGADAFADMARATWDAAGVRQSVTVDPDSHTGAAFIFLDATTGDNAIIVASGAGGRISPADMEERAALIGGASVFVAQLEQPIAAARRALELARAGGGITILNPAPAAELDDAMLALCDYITPNESEAELLTGLPVTTLPEAEAAADALLARGVGAVVMTLGERGALYRDRAKSFITPAFRVGAVAETTGAGDSFNGAFAVALSEGRPVEDAVRFGCATAGIQVTRPGAATAMPSRAEIDAVLAGG
ncbi:MAG: ribokinase [Paracoccaceae bacterium]